MSKYDERRKALGITKDTSGSRYEARRGQLKGKLSGDDAKARESILASARGTAKAREEGVRSSELSRKADEYKQYADAMKSSRLMEIENRKQEQYKEQMANARLMEQPVKEKLYKNQMEKARMMEIQNNTPSYRERINKELSGIPAILRPLASPIVALNQAPFMIAARQLTGAAPAEEENYAPVTGGGKLAGQALTTLGNITFSGAPMGGIYQQAGGALTKYVPAFTGATGQRIAEEATTAGGKLLGNTLAAGSRASGKAIQGVAEGVPTSIGQQLIMNPESSAKELGEAALYGGGISAVLPGGGQLVKEGVQGLLGMGKNAASDVVEANIRAAMDELGVIPRGQKEPLKATIGGKKAPVVPNVIPEEPVQPVEAPKQAQTAPVVSPKIAQLDAEHAKYKENLRAQQRSGAISREQAEKQIKGHAMQTAAKKREIIQGDSLVPVDGGLTAKELEAKLKYLRSDYKGKEVIAGGREGKVKNASFGKVVVEYPDGTTKSFDPEDVKPKVDIDDAIRKQSQPVEPKPVEPVKEVPVVPPVAREPGTKERGNLSTQLESERLSPELQEEILKRDNTYTPRTHAGALEEANANIKNLSEAEAKFLGNTDLSGNLDTHVANGYRLMQELDAMGEYERAANISSKLMSDLTKMGQGASAARIIQRLSPEGQLMQLQRVAEKTGKEVKTADTIVYKELAREVQEGSQSPQQTSDFMNILEKYKKGEEVSADEIKKARSILADAKKFLEPKKDYKVPDELKDVRKRDKVLSYLEKQAEEARKQWNAKRNLGFSQKLTEPDVVLLAKMATYQVAKAGVKLADFTENLVREFGEEVRPYAEEVYERAKKMIGASSKHISEGRMKEAEEAFKRLSGEEKSVYDKVTDKFIKKNNISKEKDIEFLRNLSKELNELKTTNAAQADIKMQKILNNYSKSSVVDKANTLRYIAMLLNESTQAINTLSGPIMATVGYVSDIFGSMLDMTLSAALKRPRTTTLYGSNPLRFLSSYIKNLGTGVKAGWHGADPAGITSQSDIRGLTFKGKNPLSFIPSVLERTLGAVSKGADYATYKTVFDSEIKKQAFLEAKGKGLKGDARKKYIEEYVINPPEKAIDVADKIGKNTTFQRRDTTGGKLANLIHGGKSETGKLLGSAVLPFVKTPVNIASTAVTMTPAGVIRGLFELAYSDKVTQREAIRRMGMGLTGTGLGVLGYHLSDIGIITGANDSGDKDVDQVREQAGKGKYRFNTSALGRYLRTMLSGEGEEAARKAAKYQEGDKQFDYNKLQPLAFPLAAGASMQENKGKGLAGALQTAATDSTGSLLGMSSLTGLQNITQKPLQGTQGEKSLNLLQNIAETYLKSFSPSLLAQEARRQDPTQRKLPYNQGLLKDVGAYFKSRTPGLSKELPPLITNLGDTKKQPDAFLNPYRSNVADFNKAASIISDLIDKTGDMGIAPSPPEKSVTIKGQSVKIPPDRYIKYQEDIGKEITSRILEIGEMSDEAKLQRIKDIYKSVREKHRELMKRELIK